MAVLPLVVWLLAAAAAPLSSAPWTTTPPPPPDCKTTCSADPNCWRREKITKVCCLKNQNITSPQWMENETDHGTPANHTVCVRTVDDCDISVACPVKGMVGTPARDPPWPYSALSIFYRLTGLVVQVFQSVDFASIGSPTGECGNMTADPVCHGDAGAAHGVVGQLCFGHEHCTIPANTDALNPMAPTAINIAEHCDMLHPRSHFGRRFDRKEESVPAD